MNKLKYLFFVVAIFVATAGFAKQIPVTEAEKAARNLYFEKSGISQNLIDFENVYTQKSNQEPVYYIFNIKDSKGFVIISADDLYTPVISYSLKGNFDYENMPDNVEKWMNSYSEKINFLKENNSAQKAEYKSLWNKYSTDYTNFESQKSTQIVASLTDYIKWNQDAGWNMYCPADPAGPGGHAYVGCVATAMSIIMKYWQYPIVGTGATSYYEDNYGTLSVNFSTANYFWNQMPDDTYSNASAYLMYHAAVAVHMDFGADGSGAYVGYGSYNARNALVNNFGYSSSAAFVEKSSYSTTNWINLLKAQIDNQKPILYRGVSTEGGHAFVCDGYDGDMFWFNFGWNGSQNGFYALDDVNSFNQSQGAVINIVPAGDNNYLPAPSTVEAVLDTTDFNNFTVDVNWTAPTEKGTNAVSSYKIYRGFTKIAEVSASTTNYTDNQGEVDDYNYSVRAIYSTGQSLEEYVFVKGKFSVNFNVLDPSTNLGIHQVDVTFNGKTSQTGFGSVSFYGVPMGDNLPFVLSKSGYLTTTGLVRVNKDSYFTILMDGSTNGIEELGKDFKIYPNPSNGLFSVEIPADAVQNSSMSIFDLTGKIILSQNNISKNKLTLDLSSKRAGMYLLVLNYEGKSYTKTLIIN